MDIQDSDQTILEELGKRLAQRRIAKTTIERISNGLRHESIGLD